MSEWVHDVVSKAPAAFRDSVDAGPDWIVRLGMTETMLEGVERSVEERLRYLNGVAPRGADS